jgi:4-amino-4-deoxy-L-arabinose transferase-like glycosyltransferase
MLTIAFWILLVALTYAASVRVLGSRAYALLAALFLPLTPLLSNIGRQGAEPLLFLLVWLLAVTTATDGARALWMLVAGASLGLGLYVNLTALVMMPVYLALTVIWWLVYRRRTARPIVLAVAAFAAAAVPLATFLVRNPHYLADEISRLHIYDARAYGVIRGLRELASWTGLTARSGIYYDYFSPGFLFLNGDTFDATLRQPQMFLLPFAVLVPAGIVRVLKSPVSPTGALTLAGFLVAPVAATLIGPGSGVRVVYMVPFAVLLAAWGTELLLSARTFAVRVCGWILLGAVAASFVYFCFSFSRYSG